MARPFPDLLPAPRQSGGMLSDALAQPLFDLGANKLSTVGSATLTYDGNGSLTTDQTGRTFTYDGAGRMLTSKASGTSTADKYVYDALANRIQIQLAGSTTDTRDFRYDVNHPLPVIDQVSSSAGTTNYFHDGEAPLAGKQGTDVEWFAHDELGSVTDVYFDNPATTTLKGVRARAFDYQPFGATRTAPGAPSTTYGFVPQFRYTGAVRDDATQYQMRAREYSVDTGRFNQTDPIMPMTGSIGSQYAYVTNQPTMFTDPTGMIGEPSDGGVVGTTSDLFEWAFGFNDLSEAKNVTTFNSDTALCHLTNVYDAATPMLGAIPVVGPTVGLLHNTFASSFEPREWLAQQGALNPCSAGCATADNINAAAAFVPIGAAGVAARGATRASKMAAGTSATRFVVSGSGEVRVFLSNGLEVGEHAGKRMIQKGISLDAMESAVANNSPFKYFHQGTWKTGYYERGSNLFVGSIDGKVTTVFRPDRGSDYIRDLVAGRP